jgi:hypothetical protein
MKWTARFFDILPRIYVDHPTMRYAFLTLTVKNCHVSELGATKKHMNQSLKRMIERKSFPALGYVCSFETTTEKDLYDKKTRKLIRKARPDYCHPHFHILLALPSSYFGRNYMKKDDWAIMWQSVLKVDYKPVCDIRTVKSQELENIHSDSVSVSPDNRNEAAFNGMMAAIVETIKYTVKPSDMVQNAAWFLEVAKQLHGTRSVSVGGMFKDYLKVSAVGDDLILDSEKINSGGYYFGWRNQVKRYQYIQPKTKTDDYFVPVPVPVPIVPIVENNCSSKVPIELPENPVCSDLANELRAVVASGKSVKEFLELKKPQAVKPKFVTPKPVKNLDSEVAQCQLVDLARRAKSKKPVQNSLNDDFSGADLNNIDFSGLDNDYVFSDVEPEFIDYD